MFSKKNDDCKGNCQFRSMMVLHSWLKCLLGLNKTHKFLTLNIKTSKAFNIYTWVPLPVLSRPTSPPLAVTRSLLIEKTKSKALNIRRRRKVVDQNKSYIYLLFFIAFKSMICWQIINFPFSRFKNATWIANRCYSYNPSFNYCKGDSCSRSLCWYMIRIICKYHIYIRENNILAIETHNNGCQS